MTLFEDSFVEKLREKEHAEEDVYFIRRDRDLIARLHQAKEEEQREHLRELARRRCPDCGARLVERKHAGVAIEECPLGHGMWMTESECRTVAARERSSWLGRYLYPPRRE